MFLSGVMKDLVFGSHDPAGTVGEIKGFAVLWSEFAEIKRAGRYIILWLLL